MKNYKILYIFFVFILLFSLVGCSSVELEKESIKVKEENMKTSLIIDEYTLNMKAVKAFNIDFVDSFFKEGYSFNNYTDISTIGSNIQNVKVQIEENIKEYGNVFQYEEEQIRDEIESFYTSLKGGSNIVFYPFFNEDTGYIEEHIYISYLSSQIEVIVNWENGKIVDFDYFFI